MLVAEEAVEIRVLRRQDKSIREIARMLEVSRNAVRRYVRSDGPPHYERDPRPCKLDHYKQYIAEREIIEPERPELPAVTITQPDLRFYDALIGAEVAS